MHIRPPLGCPRGARLLPLLLGLAAAPGPGAAVEALTVLGLFKDRAVLEIDGRQRLLRAGQTSPEGVTLISADSDTAVLEVDGRRVEHGLGNHIGTSYTPPAQQPAVRVWPTGVGMYRVSGSINGYPVSFLVDTGASVVAMNAIEARRLGIDYLVDGQPGLTATASGVVKSYGVQLERVRVGDIAMDGVAATVIDGAYPQEVLLGMSFLGRVDLRRDGQVLELRQRP